MRYQASLSFMNTENKVHLPSASTSFNKLTQAFCVKANKPFHFNTWRPTCRHVGLNGLKGLGGL